MCPLYAVCRIISKMPQKHAKKLISTLLACLFVLLVVFFDPDGSLQKEVFGPFNKNIKKTMYFDTCIIEEGAASTTSATSSLEVVEVSDGDTITVSRDCKPVTVRMIGVDTPETVDPRKPVQCFGKEASEFTKMMLAGKHVRIESDERNPGPDKYGRDLGYIILEDGTNFNKVLIEQGYAHEYTYNKIPYKYQAEFKAAEKEAQREKRGLWAEGVCE